MQPVNTADTEEDLADTSYLDERKMPKRTLILREGEPDPVMPKRSAPKVKTDEELKKEKKDFLDGFLPTDNELKGIIIQGMIPNILEYTSILFFAGMIYMMADKSNGIDQRWNFTTGIIFSMIYIIMTFAELFFGYLRNTQYFLPLFILVISKIAFGTLSLTYVALLVHPSVLAMPFAFMSVMFLGIIFISTVNQNIILFHTVNFMIIVFMCIFIALAVPSK